LPLSTVQQSCDRIFEQLVARSQPAGSGPASRAFVLDGTSMRLAHSPALCELYPPGRNLHGEGHWPLLRVLVVHDVDTGLAMRPEWGAMHGPGAVSEQALLETAIDRLPSRSTLIGDANFGVFSVAWAAAQRGHPVLLRLTAQRRCDWPEEFCRTASTASWSGNPARPIEEAIRSCLRTPVSLDV
jgi:hypothetical protein